MKKFEILHPKKDDWRLDAFYVKYLCLMGLPMGLQYSITAIGSVILQTAVNSLGSGAVAAMTAGSRISMFVVCPFDALGSTMATYGGQNVGAGKLKRLGEGLRSAIILGAAYSVLILLVLLVFGRNLVCLFVKSTETAVIAQADQFLIINAIFYIFLALVNIVRFLIQGMGFSVLAIASGVMEMIARGIAGILIAPRLGFAAVALAHPLAWIFADAFLIPAFLLCSRRIKAQKRFS